MQHTDAISGPKRWLMFYDDDKIIYVRCCCQTAGLQTLPTRSSALCPCLQRNILKHWPAMLGTQNDGLPLLLRWANHEIQFIEDVRFRHPNPLWSSPLNLSRKDIFFQNCTRAIYCIFLLDLEPNLSLHEMGGSLKARCRNKVSLVLGAKLQ